MYETDDRLRPYYEETEPEKRKDILDGLKTSSQDESFGLQEELFRRRYTKDGADLMLRVMMNLMGISRVGVFAIGWNAKNIKKTMEKTGFSFALDNGEAGRIALYHEIRNGVSRYIGTCDSESYGAAYSGLIKISKDDQKRKMGEQLYEMTYGAKMHLSGAKVERLEEYMNILCEAADDEYFKQSGKRLEEGEKI